MKHVETTIEADDATVVVTAGSIIKQKVVQFTRDLSLATGTQIITGIGFKPRMILFQNIIFGGSSWMATGMCSSPQNQFCLEIGIEAIKQVYIESTNCGIQRAPNSPNFSIMVLASFDPDGFTLIWEKINSPVGIGSIIAICFR